MTSAESKDDVEDECERPPVDRDEWEDARLSVTRGTSRLWAFQSTTVSLPVGARWPRVAEDASTEGRG